jgi:hypothetical protein
MEQAELLLRKAEQDAVVVTRAVGDPEIADEFAAFHRAALKWSEREIDQDR